MSGDAAPWAGRAAAVVHDWFQGYHGSERVVEAVVEDVLAEASRVDVLTFHAARELLPADLSARIVRESRLAGLPGVRQVGHDPGRWRYLLPYMPHYFRSLDLAEYSVVVASSHACALHARPPAEATYVCYCHTPMRYAWMSDTDRGRAGGLRGALGIASPWLRRIDRAAAQRPDRLVANSTAVRDRIRRFFGRAADVIHPPVELGDLAPAGPAPTRGHFLWVGRLVPYKRPTVVAETFRGLPHKLVMVGVGPQESALRKRMPDNVELRGWIARDELAELYRGAIGFIHVGEEDFGISMVEALGAGTPVIARDAGGARDIVRDDLDGVLIAEASATALAQAVRRVAETEWDRDGLAARARQFSRARFAARMRELLSEEARRRRSRG